LSASDTIAQLIRAHYAGSESAFLGAAESLVRASKLPQARASLTQEIQAGRRIAEQRRRAEAARAAGQPVRSYEVSGGKLVPLPPEPGAAPYASEFLQPVRPASFAELLLPHHVQSALDELRIELVYRKHLAERGLQARSRFLFHGPPGNGKTSCAAALAHALDVHGYVVSLADLVSKYVGGTGANLGSVLKALNGGTLVVFDEIDAIGSTRGSSTEGGGKEQNAIVNTLLTLLDANKEGVLCATTNRIDILDSALVRRFDEVIEIPAPSREQLEQLARSLEARYDVSPVDIRDCVNFDAVTKRVLREARRQVMAEILEEERKQDGEGENN
jgi:SpoVK/Ycf46/Vps4 family AAA+-type ATPase